MWHFDTRINMVDNIRTVTGTQAYDLPAHKTLAPMWRIGHAIVQAVSCHPVTMKTGV
jgi:hypothetical protein